MKNHKQEVLEIIDGFKNLTYKIKKDNDEIRDSIKNKDETIACCKTEYQKLYAEYKDLQKRYNELETYILQEQQQQQQQQQLQQLQQENNSNNSNNNNNNKKSINRYCFTLIKKGNIMWCLMMTAMKMKMMNIQTMTMTMTFNTLK